jgi:hypothetical protein
MTSKYVCVCVCPGITLERLEQFQPNLVHILLYVCLFEHNSGTPGAISTKLGTHIAVCMCKNLMYVCSSITLEHLERFPPNLAHTAIYMCKNLMCVCIYIYICIYPKHEFPKGICTIHVVEEIKLLLLLGNRAVMTSRLATVGQAYPRKHIVSAKM